MMEVLTFDRLLTQYQGFFVYFLLLCVKILENAFEIHFGFSQTFLKLSCWNLLQKQLHNYIFYISLAAIEVDLPKAVNACINHSWAYNGRRAASPYLTWRTPPFLKLDRKSPPFSMELWPPKCRLIFFFSFRRQKYQPHYILMEFVCLACAWTIKSMGATARKKIGSKTYTVGPNVFGFLNLESGFV